MRFIYNNQEYVINFLYRQKDGFTPNHPPENPLALDPWDKKHPCITVCEIIVGPVGSRDNDKEDYALGVAYQHPNDPMVKEVARKAALESATSECERNISTLIWKCYRGRFNQPVKVTNGV